MATWQEISSECFRAAQLLFEAGYPRSSISRAYYAAYCAVAGELVARGLSFAHGWRNPAHDQLPDLVLHNTDWPRNRRYQINKALRRLRRAREDADYRPDAVIELRDTVSYLRDAGFVLRTMGIDDE